MKNWLVKGGIPFLCLWFSGAVLANTVSPQTLKLLDNRFRVDYGIDVITLLIQREPNSDPVIIVQPDGSKWYAHRHPPELKWTKGYSGDMIKIPNPTPGPWQLIGEVSKHSKILLISDVTLELDPLPARVFRGQRIKLTAAIEGDDQRLAIRDFHQMLSWQVQLSSANRQGDENYAAGVRKIGGFTDTGTSLDERPNDGIFTSSLNFNQPSGLYHLKLEASNEVFSRIIEQDLEIVPQPFRLSVPDILGVAPEDYQLNVEVDVEELMPNELHLSLHLRSPSGMVTDLNISPTQPQQQIQLENVMQLGSYSINGEAVGTTAAGEEFFLTLPELSFYLAPPPPPPPSAQERAEQVRQQIAERDEAAQVRVVSVVIGFNLALLLVGGGALVFWRKRQRLVQQLHQVKEEEEPQIEANNIDLTS